MQKVSGEQVKPVIIIASVIGIFIGLGIAILGF